MLKTLSLSNFKAWSDLHIEFGRITGIFGRNSSGKTSILQFLLLLKQTKDATDQGLTLDLGGPSQLVNLGTSQQILNRQAKTSTLRWKLSWHLPEVLKIVDPMGKRTDILFSSNHIALEVEIKVEEQDIQTQVLAYIFDGYRFEIRSENTYSSNYLLAASSDSDRGFQFIRHKGRAWKLPEPIKTHLFPDQVKTYHQNANFLGLLETKYEDLMSKIYYLGPLREPPQRNYQWSRVQPWDVGYRGERAVEAILAAKHRNEKRNLKKGGKYKTLEEVVAYWLKHLGLIQDFFIAEISPGSSLYEVKVQVDRASEPVSLVDVGFGVSQILPVLVLVYYVPEDSIIIMEQPEIHLHPSAQSGLADVLLQVAHHRKLSIIVESHSEHLLRRFQRRVAEGQYEAQDIKLYFCDRAKGRSILQDLQVNKFGEIHNWPQNFFGDELSEITATRKAALKRKIQEERTSQG